MVRAVTKALETGRHVHRSCLHLSSSRADRRRSPILHREAHIAALQKGIERLSSNMSSLDASRPWCVASRLCVGSVADSSAGSVTGPRTASISSMHCRRRSDLRQSSGSLTSRPHRVHPRYPLLATLMRAGGYGGGPMQLAHLAPTYAAVNSLLIVGSPQAYNSINRYRASLLVSEFIA